MNDSRAARLRWIALALLLSLPLTREAPAGDEPRTSPSSASAAESALSDPSLEPDPSLEMEEGDLELRDEFWRLRRGGLSAARVAEAVEKARLLPEARTLPRAAGFPEKAPEDLDKAVVPGAAWVSFGPRPIATAPPGFGDRTTYSGRVAALAVDPVVATTVYAGSARGGVWKSTDGGASWAPMANESNQPTLAIGSLAVDPSNRNVIYAATGEPNSGSSHGGRGVLKSTDAGASWVLLGENDPFPTGSTIDRLVVGPTGTVWVACPSGLFRSTSGGSSWKRMKPAVGFANGWVRDVAISPNGLLLYATVSGQGLYRSANGGDTWTLASSGLPAAGTWNQRSRVAIAPSNPQVGYVVLETVVGAVFFTVNGGTSWSLMSNTNVPFGSTQTWYNLEIGVDPRNANTVYLGNLIYSVNTGGTTGGGWTQVPGAIHVDQHAIAFPPCAAAPCPYYVGNDGGVYLIRPQGSPTNVTVENKNTDLVITEFVGGDLGINFVNDARAIGGSQDNGTQVFVRADENKSHPLEWSLTLFADGGYAYLDQHSDFPSVAYAEQQAQFGLYRSTFWGYSWTPFTTGLPVGTGFFYPFYTPDRLNHAHLAYATNQAVYEIVDPNLGWYRASQTLPITPSALAIAPSASAVIYAGLFGGKVWRTDGAFRHGVAATYVDRSTGLPATFAVNSLAVDRLNPDVVYAAGSGTFTSPQLVYKTTNGGTSWTNASGNLPAGLPAFSIVTYFAGATRVLVLGTDAGVFFSTNEGASWTALRTGLPATTVAQLAIDRDQTTIAAFTAGRGAFSTNIGGGPSCSFQISPASQAVASGGGSSTINVTAPAGCAWTAASNAGFLSITSGASGSGNGTVGFSATANPGPGSRSGTLTVAGNTFTVNQAAPSAGCSASLSPASASFSSSGGVGSVGVTIGPTCNWTATSNTGFLTVTSGASGTGNGSTGYSVASNPTTSQRNGSLTIAGQTFNVTQAGAPPSGCSIVLIDHTSIVFPVEGGTVQNTFSVTPSGCAWSVSGGDFWLSISPLSGSGASFGVIDISAGPNTTGFILQTSFTVAGTTVQVAQER